MKNNQKQKEYNGHRSWNSWNVSLWFNNDYNLYKQIEKSLEKDARKFYNKYYYSRNV